MNNILDLFLILHQDNTMNFRYKFDPAGMAKDTADAYSAGSYTNWTNVCRLLATRGFNRWEAEAILRSKWTRWARDMWNKNTKPTATALANYLDKYGYKPRHPEVNQLVMESFGKELGLEADEKGVPCLRGTMPGNYHPNKTILVPLGTPLCCDPTSETYWSM